MSYKGKLPTQAGKPGIPAKRPNPSLMANLCYFGSPRLLAGVFLYFICLISFFLGGCRQQPEAQRVVDRAQATHGSNKLDQATVAFVFRDRFYRAELQDGQYAYHRMFSDSTGEVHDILTNDSFTRTVNGQEVPLPEEDQQKYAASVNGVIYFALLPHFLNDPAVRKEHLGEAEVKGEPYDKVKITFAEEGGGEDHDDVFVYWFHRDRHTLDYLAYSFQVDGGGTRFREAVNPREVNGIRFQDYVNYKTDSMQVPLEHYDRLFTNGHLTELSRVELENVRVVGE